MLTPGMVLQDRYRITGTLGKGGMGAVYEATDLRFGSVVALKETLVDGDDLRKAFAREARLLNKLRHAALPVVFDYFADGDGQFLVMQHIPGDDFAALLTKNGGPCSTEVVLHWATQLLDALEYLHTQQPPIVHRDIKPQNLKLTPRGEVILLDFGLSKSAGAGVTKATTSVSVMGYTPQYAPFEQINGSGTDPRSDLYSLAATLYHLLTGVPPTDALTRAQAVMNGEADPLPAANELNSTVNEKIAVALQAAMSMNREQRPANARTLRAMLLEGNGAASSFAATVAGTVVVDYPVEEVQQVQTLPAAQITNPTTARKPSSFLLKGGIALAVVVVIAVSGFVWNRSLRKALASTPERPAVAAPAARPVSKMAAPGELTFRFETVEIDLKGKVLGRARKEALYFTEDLGGGASIDMVAIPEGKLLMGAAETESKQYPDERPQHEVSLQRFYESKFEVTQEEWKAVAALPKVTRDLNPDPSKFKGDQLPVENVSWEEAAEFCSRLSKKSGRAYHLPSESEWEYAARAGSVKPFPFGEMVSAEFANYDGRSHDVLTPTGIFRDQTVPVGSLGAANAFGLYDVLGNVWEWCADEYHANYQGAPVDGSPRLSGGEVKHRVTRGGGWNNLAVDCRSAARLSYSQEGRRPNIGFRVAMSL